MNNILLYGYIGSNINTLDLYEAMIIDKMWDQRFFMDHINDWNIFQIKHPLKSYRRAYITRKFIEGILDKYNVSDVFWGDLNNTCYQLLMLYYYRKNKFRINIFEEGSSHYVNSSQASLFGSIWKRYPVAVINNILYYKPFWGIPFASYLYLHHIEYRELNMHKRYSLCPYYHEEYDERLFPSILMSDKINDILKNELKNIDTENAVLFLSEPVDEVTPLKWKLEVLTLEKILQQVEGNLFFVVKFHPRESGKKIKDIIEVFKRNNCSFKVICSETNIPIEYFLQVVNFKMIMTYFCSTVFYNGFLFNKTNIYSMLPVYYDYCKEYKSEFTNEIRNCLNSEYYKQLFNN